MTEQDLLRQEVLAKLTGGSNVVNTPVNEEKVKPVVTGKSDEPVITGETLLEQCLVHRNEVENKDNEIIDDNRKKILESVDYGLIGRILNPRT